MQSSEQQDSRISSQANDETLESRVRHVLATCSYAVLRQIHVSSRGGCVHLEGRVPSFYFKQLAQVTAQRAEGVTWIRNELLVQEQPIERPWQTT